MASQLRVDQILPTIGVNIGIGTAGGNIVVGGASTDVVVNGSAHITGNVQGGTASFLNISAGYFNGFHVDGGAPASSLTVNHLGNTVVGSGHSLYLTNGNLVFSTSGTGIDFSATADVSGMTSELLDDYEEGTWNPSPSFGGGQTGLTGNYSGTYTKIGRLVMVQFQLTFTNKGSSTGNLAVDGLPFNIGTNYHNVSGFSYMHRLNMGQTGGQIHIGATGSTMWIRRAGYSGNDAVLLDNGDFTNTTALWGGIVYHS